MAGKGGHDDDYDYSDSFVSDDDDDESVKKNTSTTRKVAQVTGRRKPPTNRGYKGRMSSRNTTQSQEPKVDNAVQRMLSSKNLRINELKNQMEDLKIHLQEMVEENKLLKKTQKRQEKALNKFENEESDLPQLLQRHNNEVRTLRDQLKKTQEKYQRTDRYLRDAEDELDKTKNKLKKYKNLVEDKDLLERQELQKKYQQAEIDLEERDVKVRDLEKHINHLNKNHRHELGIEIARHRDLQRQIESLRKDNDDLQTQLKEKVKAVELANIYSLRKGKKLPASYSGTPNRTPPPMQRKRNPSLHELTPREKMKMYEDKRRDDEKLHRESGDGPKMAFQTTGSSNRNIYKSKTGSKNTTYRADEKSNARHKNYKNDLDAPRSRERSSYDRDRYGSRESAKMIDPYGYDQETRKSSEQGVFSKPKMFGSKRDDRSYEQSTNYEQDVFSKPTMLNKQNTNDQVSSSVFSKPPLFRRGDNSNQKKIRTSHKKDKITANSTFLTESHDYSDSDRHPKQQERSKREREDQLRQRAEEDERRRQREREEQEMRELEQLEVTRRQREVREREDKKRRDQEAEEYLRKMEDEKRQREAEEQRVREEQKRKEREERDRRDRERQEQERRSREEKDRMEMDASLAEERMKKDELLKKLRLIDEGQNKEPEKKPNGELFFATSSKPEKKTSGGDLFFNTSSKQRRDSDGSASSSKKSYSFSKPIENMHHGKPAREDVTVSYIEKQKKQQAESPVSGYQPSFGLSSGITGSKKTKKASSGQVIFDDYEDKKKTTTTTNTNKKTNLMADLFGDTKPTRTTELDNDEIFKPPVRNTKTTATKTSTSFPWDDGNKKSTTTTTNNRNERASSLFGGGGSGILDDNDSSVFDSSKLLPKRGKQTSTTFQSKPVVSAVDHSHFDDDIEEVIL